jgi:hypothetical protein
VLVFTYMAHVGMGSGSETVVACACGKLGSRAGGSAGAQGQRQGVEDCRGCS